MLSDFNTPVRVVTSSHKAMFAGRTNIPHGTSSTKLKSPIKDSPSKTKGSSTGWTKGSKVDGKEGEASQSGMPVANCDGSQSSNCLSDDAVALRRDISDDRLTFTTTTEAASQGWVAEASLKQLVDAVNGKAKAMAMRISKQKQELSGFADEEIRAALEAIQAMEDDRKAQNTEFEETVAGLAKRIKAVESETEERIVVCDTLRDEKQVLTENINNLHGDLLRASTDAAGWKLKQSETQSQLDGTNSRIDTLQKLLDDMHTQNKALLDSQVVAPSQQDLLRTVGTLEKEIERLRNLLSGWENQSKDTRAILEGKQAEIDQLNLLVEQLNNKEMLVMTQEPTQDSQNTSSMGIVATESWVKQEKLLRAQIASRDRKIDILMGEMDTMRKKMANAVAMYEVIQRDNSQLTTQNEVLRRENGGLLSMHNTQASSEAQLGYDNKMLAAQNERLKAELSKRLQAMQESSDNQVEVLHLTNKVATLQQELEAIKQEQHLVTEKVKEKSKMEVTEAKAIANAIEAELQRIKEQTSQAKLVLTNSRLAIQQHPILQRAIDALESI